MRNVRYDEVQKYKAKGYVVVKMASNGYAYMHKPKPPKGVKACLVSSRRG